MAECDDLVLAIRALEGELQARQDRIERLRAAAAADLALYTAALAVLAAWERVPATGELSVALHRLRGAVVARENAERPQQGREGARDGDTRPIPSKPLKDVWRP